ncbi:MAG: hypothetical protein KBH45_14055, partial [Verrucomicrobia bacterium]|nr:hypothetical protein [Verrucomicrobiota bacterium]
PFAGRAVKHRFLTSFPRFCSGPVVFTLLRWAKLPLTHGVREHGCKIIRFQAVFEGFNGFIAVACPLLNSSQTT